MSSIGTSGVTTNMARLVESDPALVASLPAPDDGPWGEADVDIDHNALVRVRMYGIVGSIGRTYATVESGDGETRIRRITKYKTREGPYEKALGILERHEERGRWECGHPSDAIMNLGNGRYSCGNETCDAVYDRETAEEVFLSVTL